MDPGAVEPWSDAFARRHVEETERALAATEVLEGDARAVAEHAIESLVELYGEVLVRVLQRAAHSDRELVAALARDELVGHVLMAHGLVPAPPEVTTPPPASSEVQVQLTPRRAVART